MKHLVLFIAAALCGGCTLAKMAVPETVVDCCEAIPVECVKRWGRDAEIYRLGPFRAVRLEFRGRRERGSGIPFVKSRTTQKLIYDLESPSGEILYSECEIEWSESSAPLGGGWTSSSEQLQMSCTWKSGKDAVVAAMKLNVAGGGADGIEVGALTIGEASLRIAMTNRQADWELEMSEPTGYFFHDGDRTVGAADVLNEGILFLGRDEPDDRRHVLAAAAMALIALGDWDPTTE
jgi:hypothetical protein